MNAFDTHAGGASCDRDQGPESEDLRWRERNSMQEKRKLERFGLQLQGTVVPTVARGVETDAVKVLTRDISARGAFFTTDTPLPIGTRVKVKLLMNLAARFPQLATRPFLQATGTVVRADDRGMAVAFKNDHRFTAMAPEPQPVTPWRFSAMANA
jgi:hypothetical protein